MDNMFVTRGFDWDGAGSRNMQIGNAVLRRLGFAARLTAPRATGYMTSVEQRANIYHLVSQVLAYGVEGDLVEIGTFTGQTATLIARVVAEEGQGQRVHVYDSFGPAFGDPNPKDSLERNFQSVGVALPDIHQGLFNDTIPVQLPDKISFANVDVGFGGRDRTAKEQCDVLYHVFEHVYPRLSRGATCALSDYWSPELHTNEVHEDYGVSLACQRFFADKPERVSVLYSGSFTQGYFRKQ